MHCPYCHSAIGDNARFCGECGKPVEIPQNQCPRCGAQTQPTYKFCRKCGFALTSSSAEEFQQAPVAAYSPQEIPSESPPVEETGQEAPAEAEDSVVAAEPETPSPAAEEAAAIAPGDTPQPPEEKKCPGCGRSVAENAVFCKYCGESIPADNA